VAPDLPRDRPQLRRQGEHPPSDRYQSDFNPTTPQISFEEFFLFLFPDHDVGLALEKRRMKLLGSRVKLKAERYEKENKDHRFLGRIGPATVLPVAM
jgi:hypothetical protein